MKVYLNNNPDYRYPYYLERMKPGVWTLNREEHNEIDWKVRELNEYEANFVESVVQYFAEPMKKLMGE